MEKAFKLLVLPITLICLACTVSSCGGDSDDNTEFKSNSVPYDESMSDRSYLEETATNFMSLFSPSRQQTLITAIHQFQKICGESEFPENFSDNAAEDSQDLTRALEDNDLLSISRATTSLVYSLARFKGLYQHDANRNVFQKLEDTDDLRFRFWNGNNEYNIVISGSSDTWTESYTYDGRTYIFTVPQTLNFMLINGSSSSTSTLMTVILKTKASNGKSLTVDATIHAANIYISSTAKADNSKLTEDMYVYIDNVSNNSASLDAASIKSNAQITGTATAYGSDMCSIEAWRKASESGDIGDIVKSASSTLMLMQRVQFKSEITDFSLFGKYLDACYSTYDGDPQTLAQAAATSLIGSLRTNVYYAGDASKVRAYLSWDTVQDYSYGTYQEWSVRPLIVFTSDNTPYDFESYFGGGRFLTVEKQFGSLFSTYSSYWR